LDTIAPERRRENMRRIRSKGSAIEQTVRRAVSSLGYRYRLHDPKLPGKPDLVFSGRRKVIFVHGRFWHQHEDSSCKIVRKPKSNQSYWTPKLDKNKVRDSSHVAALEQTGWHVLIIWECEAERGQESLIGPLAMFLDGPSRGIV